MAMELCSGASHGSASVPASYRARKGASRGEGERVRERGSSGIHFWRAQKRGREVGARGSGARLWWGCGRCMEDTSVFPRIGGM